MRGKFVIAVLVVLMLMVPAHAEPGASTMQSEQQEDSRQPNNESTTLYLHHDGIATAWSHFNATDDGDDMEGEFREDKDNGVINVDLRFRMNPTLDKRLNMTVGEQVMHRLQSILLEIIQMEITTVLAIAIVMN